MLWVYDSGALYYIYFLYLTGNIIESNFKGMFQELV